MSAMRVSHKFHDLTNDLLHRQKSLGIVSSLCSFDSDLFRHPDCDVNSHAVSKYDFITTKQLLSWTSRRLCTKMPKLQVIRFDESVEGRSEMREAEIMFKKLKDSLICFHFSSLSLKHHNVSARNLIHLSLHSLSVDHRGSSSSGGSNCASVLKSVKKLRCKEMCPKVFKRLPNGLISLRTDTHGRNFINYLLKSPATKTLEILKLTNFYSQSIDDFRIPELKYLSIQGYFVHDTSTQFLRSLASSSQLRHLKLQFFTEIKQNQFPQFIKISPDEWIRFLSQLRHVQLLEIWASLVNDDVCQCIALRMPLLRSLTLHWSCLTDAALHHLSHMRHLITCKVMSEDNDFTADAIIAFADRQRNFGRMTTLSIKTKNSLNGEDERLHQFFHQIQATTTIKQIQICCIRQQQAYRLF